LLAWRTFASLSNHRPATAVEGPMAIFVWLGFVILILALLALDLGVFHRRDHVIGLRESLKWSLFYIGLALAFNVLIYFLYEHHWLGFGNMPAFPLSGREAALQFLTGYLIEKSLSLDNIFVISLIFTYFGVPLQYQHRVLFWGIMGALILRGLMIGLGAALLHRFEWIIYVFGGILLITAVRMLLTRHEEIHPDRNPMVRLARRFFPVTSHLDGHNFFTRVDGQKAATPLLLALILVENSDLIFAVDSIPAIFAVTRDPFLVFTSNIFAILGLRALYFVLAGLADRFRYLRYSIVLLLAYVGVKMLLSEVRPIPNLVSLAVIAFLIGAGIVGSLVVSAHERAHADPPSGTRS
jgi:tellurite resistance protein TerC